ncbi:MAG: lysylphosphatidylglycerol synthase transmembrane domain-containing protein, partial [Bacteroidota bacterium]
MSDRLTRSLTLTASLALGGGLLWLALRNADLEAIGQALASGEWGWMVPFVGVGLVSIAVRAWRWGLLIDALPERQRRVPLAVTSSAVVIGYFVNYAAPRLGEFARTAHVSRKADAPFSGVLGTVVAERVLDVLALALALLSVVALYGERVQGLLAEATTNVVRLLGALPLWVWIVAGLMGIASLAGIAVVLTRGRGRLRSIAEQFRDGLASVVRTGRPVQIVLSTVALWVCYGLMADIPLRLLGLDEAFGLGVVDAWSVMSIGGIGMALPAPGGTGSFHYATV